MHLSCVDDDLDVATAGAARLGMGREAALGSPHVLAGPIEALVETVLERRERWGVNYLTVNATSMHELAPLVERLAGT